MDLALNLRTNKPRPAIRGRDATRPGSKERIVANDGSINASSQKELLQNIAFLLQSASEGTINLASDNDSNNGMELTAAEKLEMFEAAYNDHKNSPVWADMGKTLAADMDFAIRREGFMRLLLQRNEIVGRVPQIRTHYNNVTAVVMTTPSHVNPQYVTGTWITTQEFDIVEHVLVNGNDINVDGEELLQEQYDYGLQSFLVAEDRAWKTAADAIVGTEIPLKIFTGDFTPDDLLDMEAELIARGVNPSTVIMHLSYWQSFLGNAANSFSNWFDPVTKYELLQTGQIGTLLGLTFVTDGYRQQSMQVLQTGEIYMVGPPEQHGGYTDRGPIMAVPVDQYNNGLDARGWFMKERLSMAIFNPASVVKGRKA